MIQKNESDERNGSGKEGLTKYITWTHLVYMVTSSSLVGIDDYLGLDPVDYEIESNDPERINFWCISYLHVR